MIRIKHDGGFYSNCSVRLGRIVKYFNKHHKLPEKVKCREQYVMYKPKNTTRDITHDFFVKPKHIEVNIPFNSKVDYTHSHQWKDYKKEIDYPSINPFIHKYFTPKPEIIQLQNQLIKKYNIDIDNTCVLFLRGNRKILETKLCKYPDFIEQAKKIQAQNPNIRFLIQSDVTDFIQTMKKAFPNSFTFKDETKSLKKSKRDVERVYKDQAYQLAKNFLAIMQIMAKCQYIICGSSGNCNIWITFFRGNANNLIQFHHNKFV